jgi:glycosyltransferase involved in cell wall biosynthesis
MSDRRPSVTVLMSVYNGLPYLGQAVESIRNQTFSDFEFLIIDDASTDGSRERLKKWANRDARIHLILHSRNRGLGYSLHEGVKKARGDWIARMDADDLAFPGRLKKQLAYVEEHSSIDILGTWALDIDGEGTPLQQRTYPVDHAEIARLIWTNPLVHPTVMFRKSAVQAAGSYDPDLRKRQDYELWFRCLKEGLCFGNVPEILLRYRFTEEYYERNDLQVAWNQAKIGWKGCWRVGASPVAYVGVGAPVLRALLPLRMNRFLHKQLRRVDPRRGSSRDL